MLIARLSPAPGAVAHALRVARSFSDARDLPSTAADRLAVVVEEWVANVVEHGAAHPDSRIILRMTHRSDHVRLTVSDAGRPFDPREAVFAGPNAERGGGAGLELIRAWSRIVDYRRRAGRNRLVLVIPLD